MLPDKVINDALTTVPARSLTLYIKPIAALNID